MAKDKDKGLQAPSKVYGFVKNILGEYSSEAFTFVQSDASTDEKRIYVLNGESGHFGEDDNQNRHYIIPILYGVRGKFWLSCSITFKKYLNKFSLKGVSLGVYQGSDSEFLIPKELLFRAEWDSVPPADRIKMPHAQPHWHVHSSNDNRFPALGFVVDDEPEEFAIDENDDIIIVPKTQNRIDSTNILPLLYRFHFSMSSNWSNTSTSINDLDEKGMRNWVRYCVEYIKEQFDYLAG